MRQTPAHYRNGYHRTLTRKQRRNRWLLWAVLALLTLGGNRLVAGCQRVKPVDEPRPVMVTTAYVSVQQVLEAWVDNVPTS